MIISKLFASFYSKQISVPVRVQGLENVRLIAVGAFHNLALQEDGTLWAWGNNEYGQLGTGDTQPRSQPIPVQGLSGLTLVCIVFSSVILLISSSLCVNIKNNIFFYVQQEQEQPKFFYRIPRLIHVNKPEKLNSRGELSGQL